MAEQYFHDLSMEDRTALGVFFGKLEEHLPGSEVQRVRRLWRSSAFAVDEVLEELDSLVRMVGDEQLSQEFASLEDRMGWYIAFEETEDA